MTNTTMINYSTRDFATKEQLELYLLRQEKAFSPEVINCSPARASASGYQI